MAIYMPIIMPIDHITNEFDSQQALLRQYAVDNGLRVDGKDEYLDVE
jgi:hypothetical protein